MKRTTNIQQNVKTAEIFGGLDIFATLSLSLSLSLTHIAQTRAHTLIKLAGARVNIRLFVQKCMGSLFIFCSHQ